MGFDYDKHKGEAEAYASASRRDEAMYKKAGFEHRIDRANEALRQAKTEAEKQKFEEIRNKSIKIYNKYSK